MVERHGSATQLPLDNRELKMAQTGTTDTLRKVAGIKSQINRFLFDLLRNFMRHFAGTFDQLFVRVNFVFNETADRIRDHLVFFCQTIGCHGGVSSSCCYVRKRRDLPSPFQAAAYSSTASDHLWPVPRSCQVYICFLRARVSSVACAEPS